MNIWELEARSNQERVEFLSRFPDMEHGESIPSYARRIRPLVEKIEQPNVQEPNVETPAVARLKESVQDLGDRWLFQRTRISRLEHDVRVLTVAVCLIAAAAGLGALAAVIGVR